MTNMPLTVTIHIDGGSRGNPGPAAAGVVITDSNGAVLCEAGIYIGEATNNVAEYSGLVAALEKAAKLGAREIDLYSDSELLVKQMLGEYRVKNARLRSYYQQAAALARQFDRVDIRHVRREQNTQADLLVNLALDCRADIGGELS